MKLATTPYQVYYLINNDDNTLYMFFNWLEDQHDDSSVQVKAYMTEEGNFNSVQVKSSTRLYDEEGELVVNYSTDSWDDINPDVVDAIKRYYRTRQKECDTIIRYADMIQALIEDKNSFNFEISGEGRIKIDINGLPYINDNGELSKTDITVSSSLVSHDYSIAINDHRGRYPLFQSCRELRESYEKAQKYDALKDNVNSLIDNPFGFVGSFTRTS